MKRLLIQLFRKIHTILITFFIRNIEVHGTVSGYFKSKIKVRENGKISFGNNVSTLKRCLIAARDHGDIRIGDNCFFNYNCFIVSRGSISIGPHCIFGPNVFIYDHDHKYGNNGLEEGYKVGTIKIGSNCWIGAGTIILRNTVIGDNCIIGAGTVVSGNIPDNSIVTGIRSLCVKQLQPHEGSM